MLELQTLGILLGAGRAESNPARGWVVLCRGQKHVGRRRWILSSAGASAKVSLGKTLKGILIPLKIKNCLHEYNFDENISPRNCGLKSFLSSWWRADKLSVLSFDLVLWWLHLRILEECSKNFFHWIYKNKWLVYPLPFQIIFLGCYHFFKFTGKMKLNFIFFWNEYF